MPKLFLSYSREDVSLAGTLERALKRRKLDVWRDERSIAAGDRWADEIERGLRESRGVVVLVTESSSKSPWVTYEYALAVGAQVPIVAVRTQGTHLPDPIRRFQVVDYLDARRAAEKIDQGILKQSRSAGENRATTPRLIACFQERNGELALASGGKTPSIEMDLWMDGVPKQTKRVAFEIMDIGFRDRKWSVSRMRRTDSVREFLTDDMNSYGDVEICARGVGPGKGSWSTTSRLHEALVRYYRGRSTGPKIRRALRQIRDN